MIANVVTGRVDGNEDESVIRERMIPAFQGVRGYEGGYWLRQPDGDEVLAVTIWESEEALQAAFDNPTVQGVIAQTSARFIGGPKIAIYRLVARG